MKIASVFLLSRMSSYRNQVSLHRYCCDHSTGEGGWIVIQKRVNGTTRFNLSHEKYTIGFGNFEREFWLGLNKIHALTTSDRFILRVELEDWDGSTAFAEYDNFVVGNESSGYKLEKLGRYKGIYIFPFDLNLCRLWTKHRSFGIYNSSLRVYRTLWGSENKFEIIRVRYNRRCTSFSNEKDSINFKEGNSWPDSRFSLKLKYFQHVPSY